AVYRARHRALNRIVCVKILSPGLSKDKKAVELFLTEARAIAELDHPNIVNVYNVGKEGGYYFIVMSFIEGQTLSAMLKKEKVLPINRVLNLFDGVLQGLAAAHEKGIIHRDIKPSNILVTPQGQAKLVDFGIAKKVDKSTGSTKTTELAGTAYFIAPEQALGKNLDTRADLYSIGASLYYVLTGHFPYNGKNTIEIIQKHINDPVPDPAKLRKELPTWLAEAIQKLMNKNPDDRFQSAKEVYLHFRKMRAEDQLRVKYGSAGRAIDLGSEGPLQVATEDKHSVQTLRAQRAGAKGFSSSTQPTFNKSMLPQINVEQLKEEEDETHQRSSSKTPSAQMLSADEVKPVNVFTPVRKKTRRKPSQAGAFLAQNLKNLGLLFLFLPLLAIFGAVVVYTFYSLGQICSVHVSSTSGLLHNIVAPFMVSSYAPNQLLLTGICFVVVTVIFASSAIRAFSRSTTTLLFLAIVSFFAGLFTPEVPFMEIKEAGKFLFSPEYYLCYLVLALVWGISLCWKLNRSASQGILAAVLVLFTMSLAFLSSHLSIPPNQQEALFTAILYTALFCGICSCYYLIARSHKDSILLPCC
ncbi:MAG: protein kinase, partial [Elusimicrobiaceae bacterium]|nr:protein kinase [Elusimicrobiaceae bacterium]